MHPSFKKNIAYLISQYAGTDFDTEILLKILFSNLIDILLKFASILTQYFEN